MAQVEAVDNIIQELRRGVIVLAVLSQLEQEQYGYSVMKLLADRGLDVDQGTIYPLLRRLESQGLLQSDWRLQDARPRRYYVISPEGRGVLEKLKEEWLKMVNTIDPLLNHNGSEKKKHDLSIGNKE